jgi:hypothetical protein
MREGAEWNPAPHPGWLSPSPFRLVEGADRVLMSGSRARALAELFFLNQVCACSCEKSTPAHKARGSVA